MDPCYGDIDKVVLTHDALLYFAGEVRKLAARAEDDGDVGRMLDLIDRADMADEVAAEFGAANFGPWPGVSDTERYFQAARRECAANGRHRYMNMGGDRVLCRRCDAEKVEENGHLWEAEWEAFCAFGNGEHFTTA